MPPELAEYGLAPHAVGALEGPIWMHDGAHFDFGCVAELVGREPEPSWCSVALVHAVLRGATPTDVELEVRHCGGASAPDRPNMFTDGSVLRPTSIHGASG
eukprot:12168386-Alexandrium_andersonii.AAC.1